MKSPTAVNLCARITENTDYQDNHTYTQQLPFMRKIFRLSVLSLEKQKHNWHYRTINSIVGDMAKKNRKSLFIVWGWMSLDLCLALSTP